MGDEPGSNDDESRTTSTLQPRRLITPGLGMPKALFALVIALAAAAGLVVGVAARWSLAAIVIVLLLSAGITFWVARHSQRDLFLFKQEHGRWPSDDDLDDWSREMRGRREKAKGVAAAASVAEAAEDAYRKRIAKAEITLQAAQRQRENSIANAKAALAGAERGHASAVAQAAASLDAWRNPGHGMRIAAFKGLQLYQHTIVSGNRVAPIGTTQAAVAGNSLMINSGTFQVVIKLTKNDVPGALQFASQVLTAVSAEIAFEHQRPEAVPAAEAYLAHVAADTSSITAARTAVEETEGNAQLLASIRDAEANLTAERANTRAVDDAREDLQVHQESAVERGSPQAPATWTPRASNAGLAIAGIAVVTLLVGGIGAVATAPALKASANIPSSSPVTTTAQSSPTATPETQGPTPSAVTSPSSTPTATPSPTPRPTPTPTAPPIQLVQQAQGSKVISLAVPKGNFKVTWETQGRDNFIVYVLGSGGQKINLVNEIAPEPASGQFLFPSPGGTFNFEITAATLTWKLSFDQLLWPANPASSSKAPTTLSGQNSVVSAPVYLPTGVYKLAWSSQGSGNFVVRLHWGSSGERLLVNEIPPDPSSGETSVDSGGGYHLLAVYAPNQHWTITLTPL